MNHDEQKHKEIMDTLKAIALRIDDHEVLDTKRFSEVVTKPTPEEIQKNKEEFEESVQNAMTKALFSTSKWTYRTLIVVAIIFGSLATIGVGLKTILGWVGFGILNK